MKRTFWKGLVIAAGFISLTACDNAGRQTADPGSDLDSTAGENTTQIRKVPILIHLDDSLDQGIKSLTATDPIRFPEYQLTKAEGDELLVLTRDHLRLNGSPLMALAAEIPVSSLNTLKGYVSDLGCSPACSNDVPGVKIHYGMTAGAGLKLYYEIVYFCAVSAPSSGVGYYRVCREGRFYLLNAAGVFEHLDTPAKISDMDSDVARYKVHPPADPYGIQVRNPDSGQFENYNADKDVRYVIYPIDQLIMNGEEASGNSVKLWSVPLGYEISNLDVVVHHIIASSANVSLSAANVLTSPANAVYSDMAHICPPGCNTIYKFKVN